MNTRILSTATAIAFVALSATSHAAPIRIAAPPAMNVAATGTVTVSQVLAGSTAVLNDMNGTNQIDIGPPGPGSKSRRSGIGRSRCPSPPFPR